MAALSQSIDPEFECLVDDSDDDGEDDEILETDSKCFWCDKIFANPENVYSHCNADHQFNFENFFKKHQLDFYGYIRFVNYMRKNKPSVSSLELISDTDFNDEQYLFPQLPDDALLRFDVEQLIEDNLGDGSKDPVATETMRLKKDQEEKMELQERLKVALEQIEQMRATAHVLFASGDVGAPTVRSVQSLDESPDNAYFGSYGHFGIHEEMLQDNRRTEFYEQCIALNPRVFEGAVVLDVGCGTGILSMFAARHGARQVIAVEMSDIIYNAMAIARDNGMDEKITFIKGRIEDVKLPVDQVDVIISEWMGYFLLYESMLDSVLWARDRYLRPSGLMLPNTASLYLIGVSDLEERQKRLEFWNNVYGFNMSCMKSAVIEEAIMCTVLEESIVTEPSCVLELDLQRCHIADLEFRREFSLQSSRDTTLTALAGYFTVALTNVQHQMTLDTSPCHPATHWKQTVFLLRQTLDLKKDEAVPCHVTCNKNIKDPRSLNVTLKVKDLKQMFFIQ